MSTPARSPTNGASSGGIWENTVSATKFDCRSLAQRAAGFRHSASGRFRQLLCATERDARRYGWSSSFEFRQWNHWGSHNFKAGIYAAESTDDGQMIEHPIEIQAENAASAGADCVYRRRSLPERATRSWRFTSRTIGCSDRELSLDLGLRFEHQAISRIAAGGASCAASIGARFHTRNGGSRGRRRIL